MYAIGGIVVIAALLIIVPNYYSGENVIIISGLFSVVGVVLFVILFTIPLSKIWRFWAFSRVENVHELKKRLILLGDISETDILFKKIENSTEFEMKYWKLRLKFAQEDIFEDDETIPEETLLYYSKPLSITLIVFSIYIFALGSIFLLFAVDAKIYIGALFGVLLIILAVFLGYRLGYKKLKNREPQLTLNSKGISTNKNGFHKWEEIKKCHITVMIDNVELRYTHSRGNEKINIRELNIKNGIRLSKLLMVYRERNKIQNNRRQ